MKKTKIAGIAAIITLITFFILLGISGVDFTGIMISINELFYNKLGNAGVYLATFIISTLGTSTVLVPVPYLMIIMMALITLPVNPLAIAVISALGSAFGELSAWLIGRGASEVLKKKNYEDKLKGIRNLIKKGYGFWLVFIFNATPLPGDILLVALGIEKFPILTIITGAFLGKLALLGFIVLITLFMKRTIIGQSILSLYGIEFINGEVVSTGETLLSTIITVSTIIITIAIIVIDWGKIARRIKQWKKT